MQVFGSWARGDAHADSDLDLLVKLERGRSLLDVVALQRELEAVAGRKVDVVTEGALSRYLRERVLQEARPL
jgi:predicted nucleotidyltransferase